MQTQPLTNIAAAALADTAALDQAFEALKTYDWGTDRKPLAPLEDAVPAVLGDAKAHAALEARLAAVLKTDAPRDAKDVVCRHLRVLGTARSVPTLAGLLTDKDLSHMARYALERIQDPAAGAALREALSKVDGALEAGIAGSLGARRDSDAVPALIESLGGSDASVAIAAATALGAIATPKAAKALTAAAKTAPAAARNAVIDGALRAAEQLASAGKKGAAKAVYEAFAGGDAPEHVKQAARRGLSEV